MIPPKLARLFTPDVRSRGDSYFAEGRVRIVRADDHVISARVRGTTDYQVSITAGRRAVVIECTCPYASDWGICKHGWAVVRQADTIGRLSTIISTAGPSPLFSLR